MDSECSSVWGMMMMIWWGGWNFSDLGALEEQQNNWTKESIFTNKLVKKDKLFWLCTQIWSTKRNILMSNPRSNLIGLKLKNSILQKRISTLSIPRRLSFTIQLAMKNLSSCSSRRKTLRKLGGSGRITIIPDKAGASELFSLSKTAKDILRIVTIRIHMMKMITCTENSMKMKGEIAIVDIIEKTSISETIEQHAYEAVNLLSSKYTIRCQPNLHTLHMRPRVLNTDKRLSEG